MKKLLGSVAAILISATIGAVATQGILPTPGFRLIDGLYVLGLSAGVNNTFQSGIAAAGTTQATATQIAAGFTLLEVDTVGASSGVALPQCNAGTIVQSLYNNTSTTLTVYPQIANNSVTVAQDTINNTTSYSINAHTGIAFACAKNGIWAAS